MMTCTAKELCAATGGTLVQDGEGFSCVSTDSRREALMQLAAEGDENAVAELFIAYGIDLSPVAL